MTLCACGCGRDVLSGRPDALYATSACRARAARARAGTALLSEREVRLIREAARRLQPDPLAPDLLAIADRARQMRLALRGKGPQKAHMRILGGDRLGGGTAPCS